MSDFLQRGTPFEAAPPDPGHRDPGHPDSDQLSAFVEQALPTHEREQTLAHLAHCSACRTVVGLSLPPEAPSFVQDVPEHPSIRPQKPFFSGWNLAWPVAAAVACFLLVFVYLRNAGEPRRQALAVQETASSRPPDTSLSRSAPERRSDHLADASLPATGRTPVGGSSSAQDSPNRAGLVGAQDKARSAASAETNVAHGSPSATDTLLAPRDSAPPLAQKGASPADALDPSHGKALSRADLSPLPAGGMRVSAMQSAMATPDAPALHGTQPLPSGLPILSIAAHDDRVLALDAHHTLFLSHDSGQNWQPVSGPWSGHATRVNFIGSSHAPAPGTPSSAFSYGHVTVNPAGALIHLPLATLSGSVTDSSGATIPGATIHLSNAEAQTSLILRTDASGRYLAQGLPPGSYQLQAESPGFQKRLLSGIPLASGQFLETNLTLAVGDSTQTVTVSAAPPLDAKQVAPAKSASTPHQTAAKSAPRAFASLKDAPATGLTFEIFTDTGDRWTSSDGQLWKPSPPPAK